MPSPSSALSTLRPDLQQSFTEFDLAMNMQGFIGQRICPVIDVDRASGNFGRIPIEQLLQNPDTLRAPGSGYNRGKFTFKPDTYVTVEHGYEEPVDDAESAMYASYFDAEQVSALRAHHAVLLAYEQRVVTVFTDGATWTGGKTAAAAVPWDTLATAAPLTDIESAVQAVFAASGLWPNAIIMSRIDFRNLRNDAQVIDRVKYSGFMDTRAGNITPQAIAQCLDIDEVIVAGSSYNSANDGQTASLATVWPKGSVMVAHIDRSNDIRRPTVARTFHWSSDGSDINGTVETYRDEPKRSDIVRVRHQTGEKLLYSVAGFLITSTHSCGAPSSLSSILDPQSSVFSWPRSSPPSIPPSPCRSSTISSGSRLIGTHWEPTRAAAWDRPRRSR
jgi:hypothetical protein